MAYFQYILTLGLQCEAENYDEACDKFQKMTIDQAFWDNTNTGVYECDENGKEIENVQF